MNKAKHPSVTEEPLPGWQRFEVEGQKPWFKTPAPRAVIRDAKKLQSFLDKEHQQGRMLNVDGTEFSFKRRLGLQKKSVAQGFCWVLFFNKHTYKESSAYFAL